MISKNMPHLEAAGDSKKLIVDGRPFVMIAGEVHNSASSSSAYMEKLWEQAKALELNSLILPVTWEMTEPKEGKFDFSVPDALIRQARAHGMKIQFLWFGAWKNAQCFYAPAWVKRDTGRFLRAELQKGEKAVRNAYGMEYSTLSAFCEETLRADAAAFAALMAHLKEVDGEAHTVILVQVENETGLLERAREHSDEAERRFAEPVPAAFRTFLVDHPSLLSPELAKAFAADAADGADWTAVFGEMAEEVFTAYYTASYVEQVARAGKEVYPLPMTANCWLDRGQKPGMYPTGGPIAKTAAVWRFGAPDIDILAPDIYIPDFAGVCREYAKNGNPLCIAECALHAYAGLREIYTIGRHHAICYSPFGIEDIGKPFTAVQGALFGMDTTDEALKTPQDPEEYRKINHLLQGLLPLVTEKYGTRDLVGAISEVPKENSFVFGPYRFTAAFGTPILRRKNGACLLVQKEEGDFYCLAVGCALVLSSADETRPHSEYLLAEEGEFAGGSWQPGIRCNGDEVQIMSFEEPTLLHLVPHVYG